MSTQWHPLFAHLLTLLVEPYYTVETEVPVSDLPRRGDLLLIRRQGSATPHFQGLWSRLTDWNVVEFKGPSDDAEIDDLELLAHVGTGLTYRLNEKRQPEEPRIANRQMAFWYLAPKLGETFLSHARMSMYLKYETGGLWRGAVWGHPVYLLSYEDAPVEEDTIPMYLLGAESKTPKELGTLVLGREELMRCFAKFFSALQPILFEEIRQMADKRSDGPRLNWGAIAKFADLGEVIDAMPPKEIIARLGVDVALETIGVAAALEKIGADGILAAPEGQKLMEVWKNRLTKEQLQEMLRAREHE